MKSFTDNMDDEWRLEVTIGEVRRVKRRLGLDLLSSRHHLMILDSLTDRLAFIAVLCEDQMKHLDVSLEEFEKRLEGVGFADNASAALLDEFSDFFRRYGQEGQAKINDRSLKVMKAGKERMVLMAQSGEFDAILDSAESELEKIFQGSDGSGSQS